ncbi:MAG: hypothetical protein AAF570_04810 [Bacteroidota bacterium]
MYSIEQLERMAGSGTLSSYEGDEGQMYEVAYTGFDDDLVDFGGNGVESLSFADEIKSGKHFSVEITNAHATDTLNMYLFGGDLYDPGTNGVMTEGAFNDIDAKAGLTATGDPFSVDRLLKWCNKNPSRIAGIKIQSTVASQLEKTIVIEKWSPFRQLPTHYIRISNYKDENDFQDKIATIRDPFQVDDQTLVKIPIPIGTTTITLYFGGSINLAKALDKKSQRAGRTMQKYGVHNVNAAINRPRLTK